MLCYKKHPHFRKLETVPPMCPHGFHFVFVSKTGQITLTIGKHRAKQELETVPPGELGTVPPKGSKK